MILGAIIPSPNVNKKYKDEEYLGPHWDFFISFISALFTIVIFLFMILPSDHEFILAINDSFSKFIKLMQEGFNMELYVFFESLAKKFYLGILALSAIALHILIIIGEVNQNLMKAIKIAFKLSFTYLIIIIIDSFLEANFLPPAVTKYYTITTFFATCGLWIIAMLQDLSLEIFNIKRYK